MLETMAGIGEVPWEMAMLMISLQKGGLCAVEFHSGAYLRRTDLDETRPRSPGGNKLLMWRCEKSKEKATKRSLCVCQICFGRQSGQQIISTALLFQKCNIVLFLETGNVRPKVFEELFVRRARLDFLKPIWDYCFSYSDVLASTLFYTIHGINNSWNGALTY